MGHNKIFSPFFQKPAKIIRVLLARLFNVIRDDLL